MENIITLFNQFLSGKRAAAHTAEIVPAPAPEPEPEFTLEYTTPQPVNRRRQQYTPEQKKAYAIAAKKNTLDKFTDEILSYEGQAVMAMSFFGFNKHSPSAKYSLLNKAIIASAGTVDSRGFREWQKAGRKVNKGAKAVYIFAPAVFKRTKTDIEVAAEAALAAEGYQCETSRVILYKLIPVFPIEQTNGDPVPCETAAESLNIDTLPLMDIAAKLGVSVAKAPLVFRGAAGLYKHGEKKIILGTDDRLVFLHELSHAVDHALPNFKNDSKLNEVTAELSASFLASFYGLTFDMAGTRDYIKNHAGKSHPAWKIAKAIGRVKEIFQYIAENTAQETPEMETAAPPDWLTATYSELDPLAELPEQIAA